MKKADVLRVTGTVLFSLALLASLIGLFAGIRMVPVLTGSMTPSYSTGAVAVTHRISTDQVRVGDVIAFAPPAPFSEPNSRPVLHRVTSLSKTTEGVTVQTKGDANPSADPWNVTLDDANLYRAEVGVPMIGRVVTAITSSDVSIRSLAVLGVVLIAGAVVCWPRNRCECSACEGFLIHA